MAALNGIVLHQTGLSFWISVWLPAMPTPVHLDQCCAISTSPIKTILHAQFIHWKKYMYIEISKAFILPLNVDLSNFTTNKLLVRQYLYLELAQNWIRLVPPWPTIANLNRGLKETFFYLPKINLNSNLAAVTYTPRSSTRDHWFRPYVYYRLISE
jgi:hypothetical protein